MCEPFLLKTLNRERAIQLGYTKVYITQRSVKIRLRDENFSAKRRQRTNFCNVFIFIFSKLRPARTIVCGIYVWKFQFSHNGIISTSEVALYTLQDSITNGRKMKEGLIAPRVYNKYRFLIFTVFFVYIEIGTVFTLFRLIFSIQRCTLRLITTIIYTCKFATMFLFFIKYKLYTTKTLHTLLKLFLKKHICTCIFSPLLLFLS